MKEVLSYELGDLPYSLATHSGSLVKTTKSKLLQALLVDTENIAGIPKEAVVILDGMAVLQSTKPTGDTFGALATQLLVSVLSNVPEDGRVDFVCDQYPTCSIKSAERQRRAQSTAPVVRITGPEQRLPQWKTFMSVSENKVGLIDFLVASWSTSTMARYFKQRKLYVTVGNHCRLLTSPDRMMVESSNVTQLASCQEEADTRMLLHAGHASSNGATVVVVKSPDTDVAVIGLWASGDLSCRLLLQTGTGQQRKLVDLSALRQLLGSNVCSALPGLHAFTGCDSVSSFSRRGKKQSYKLIRSGHWDAMKMLGASLSVSEDLVQLCEVFVCRLYGKGSLSCVDDLRYELFCQSSRMSYAELPPTKDALRHHIQRANYQTYIWKTCLKHEAVPSPHQHGWLVAGDSISIVWITRPPAPSALLHALMHCGCSGGCSSTRCTCFRANVKCTDVCQCSSNCSNQPEPVAQAPGGYEEVDTDSADEEM